MNNVLPPEFFSHDRHVRAAALRRFRRTHQTRRATQGIVLALVIGAAMFLTRTDSSERLEARALPVPLPSRAAAKPPASPAEPHLLSDAELLAAFPPGSCFLAEVNGQKRLVFRDPAVRKKFMN